tara:strand:- start:5668 stop:5928 length:261 start_codon:yes stop_codon:yes gene_type:complete
MDKVYSEANESLSKANNRNKELVYRGSKDIAVDQSANVDKKDLVYRGISCDTSYYSLAKIMAAHPNRKINGQYRRLYYRGLMPHKL